MRKKNMVGTELIAIRFNKNKLYFYADEHTIK
jgi:hypothetical protein